MKKPVTTFALPVAEIDDPQVSKRVDVHFRGAAQVGSSPHEWTAEQNVYRVDPKRDRPEELRRMQRRRAGDPLRPACKERSRTSGGRPSLADRQAPSLMRTDRARHCVNGLFIQ